AASRDAWSSPERAPYLNLALVDRLAGRDSNLPLRELEESGADRRSSELFEGVWLDCLLGSGFRGPLSPPLLELMRWLNARQEVVVAVDVPSGLDATTGAPSPEAVRAQATITLGAEKPALARASARPFVGVRLVVGDVGWPQHVRARFRA